MSLNGLYYIIEAKESIYQTLSKHRQDSKSMNCKDININKTQCQLQNWLYTSFTKDFESTAPARHCLLCRVLEYFPALEQFASEEARNRAMVETG